MRALLLVLPIAMTLLVSGCTAPDFLCFLPGLCGKVVEEEHDVIVIDSLQALPNNVPPEGSIKLIAIVSNRADINAEIKNVEGIKVELYDYCEGLFTIKDNAGGTSSGDNKQTIEISLLRGEKKQLEWTLEAEDKTKVPVKTECTLKIRARYPYATRSLTTLHLIDYAEMQRRISEGTFKQIGSYQSIGYGPLKPYIKVDGTQPIPVDKDGNINTVLTFQIVNKGQGFLSSSDGKPNAGKDGFVIKRPLVKIEGISSESGAIESELNACLNRFFKNGDNTGKDWVKLIKKETTPMPCPISKPAGPVAVESTKTIQASLGTIKDGKATEPYWYEFRDDIKVTVEPKY